MPQFWNDIMEIPEARWIVYGTLLIFAVLVAVYVSLFFRNMAIGRNEDKEVDLLSEFRNLRDQGHLDDQEFDRLKSVVPDNAKHELLRGVPGNGQATAEKKKFMTLAQAEEMKQGSQVPVDDQTDQQTDSP